MRLIDADKLKQAIPETKIDIFENCGNCTCLTDEQVKELIDDAPTIEALKEQQPRVLSKREAYDLPDESDVPMKPVKSAIPRYGMGYEYFDWICPVCKKFLAYEPDKESIPKRCKNCGQLIETH